MLCGNMVCLFILTAVTNGLVHRQIAPDADLHLNLKRISSGSVKRLPSNASKVNWPYDYDSACYNAEVSTSSNQSTMQIKVSSGEANAWNQTPIDHLSDNPFVHVIDDDEELEKDVDQTKIEVKVEVPSVLSIVGVYGAMFVPLSVGWLYFVLHDEQSAFTLLLTLTLCCSIVAVDLANQVLSVLMGAPLAITALQALAMGVVLGAWGCFIDVPSTRREELSKLKLWMVVVVFYAAYQTVNHYVSLWCTLSERVVITNLCPVLSLVLEVTIMPAALKMKPTVHILLALGCMVIGAVVYGCGDREFSKQGLMVASSLLLLVVPYRLVQRYILSECWLVPVSILAAMDGLFLGVILSPLAASFQTNTVEALTTWFANGAIVPVLLLSCFSGSVSHVSGLVLLKVGSATNYLVFHNLANLIIVLSGIILFKDAVNPKTAAGLLLSLIGGLWYAFEANKPKEIEVCILKPGGEVALDADKSGAAVSPKAKRNGQS